MSRDPFPETGVPVNTHVRPMLSVTPAGGMYRSMASRIRPSIRFGAVNHAGSADSWSEGPENIVSDVTFLDPGSESGMTSLGGEL